MCIRDRYYERGIDIVKEGITLQGIPFELGNGSDTGKPFIDGEGKNYVFLFDAENITLDGFHIENKGGTGNDIIDITKIADGSIISNNDLSNTSMCFIYVKKSSNNKIINNTISHSLMGPGIMFYKGTSDNIVRGNVISDCEDGIVLWDSDHNLIERNIIQNCRRFGIDNTYKNNTIQYNLFKDNLVGYQTYFGMHSTITYNNFINNQVHAQFLNSRLRYLITNKWIGNYWDRGRILPYPIRGLLFIFPWIQFDWHPALVPNEI